MCVSFPGGSVIENLPASAGDSGGTGLIPGLGRAPGGENNIAFEFSCLEDSMDRGAWRATVGGVTKSQTRTERARTWKMIINFQLIHLMSLCAHMPALLLQTWESTVNNGHHSGAGPVAS